MDSFRDNRTANRYELDIECATATADYRIGPGVVTVTYTEVPPSMRGRGIGAKLSRAVLEQIRAEGLKVIPRCGFFARFIKEHPEYHDLLAEH